MWTALDTIWLPNVVLMASPYWTSSVHIRGYSMDCSRDECLSRLISHYYYPKLSIIGYVDSARYDMVAQCGAGGQPKSDLLSTHMRLWLWPYERRWSEPVALSVVLCQTKLNWSLAAVEADTDSATYDMEAQCGAGGQPKSDLLSTHTRLW